MTGVLLGEDLIPDAERPGLSQANSLIESKLPPLFASSLLVLMCICATVQR